MSATAQDAQPPKKKGVLQRLGRVIGKAGEQTEWRGVKAETHHNRREIKRSFMPQIETRVGELKTQVEAATKIVNALETTLREADALVNEDQKPVVLYRNIESAKQKMATLRQSKEYTEACQILESLKKALTDAQAAETKAEKEKQSPAQFKKKDPAQYKTTLNQAHTNIKKLLGSVLETSDKTDSLVWAKARVEKLNSLATSISSATLPILRHHLDACWNAIIGFYGIEKYLTTVLAKAPENLRAAMTQEKEAHIMPMVARLAALNKLATSDKDTVTQQSTVAATVKSKLAAVVKYKDEAGTTWNYLLETFFPNLEAEIAKLVQQASAATAQQSAAVETKDDRKRRTDTATAELHTQTMQQAKMTSTQQQAQNTQTAAQTASSAQAAQGNTSATSSTTAAQSSQTSPAAAAAASTPVETKADHAGQTAASSSSASAGSTLSATGGTISATGALYISAGNISLSGTQIKAGDSLTIAANSVSMSAAMNTSATERKQKVESEADKRERISLAIQKLSAEVKSMSLRLGKRLDEATDQFEQAREAEENVKALESDLMKMEVVYKELQERAKEFKDTFDRAFKEDNAPLTSLETWEAQAIACHQKALLSEKSFTRASKGFDEELDELDFEVVDEKSAAEDEVSASQSAQASQAQKLDALAAQFATLGQGTSASMSTSGNNVKAVQFASTAASISSTAAATASSTASATATTSTSAAPAKAAR